MNPRIELVEMYFVIWNSICLLIGFFLLIFFFSFMHLLSKLFVTCICVCIKHKNIMVVGNKKYNIHIRFLCFVHFQFFKQSAGILYRVLPEGMFLQ